MSHLYGSARRRAESKRRRQRIVRCKSIERGMAAIWVIVDATLAAVRMGMLPDVAQSANRAAQRLLVTQLMCCIPAKTALQDLLFIQCGKLAMHILSSTGRVTPEIGAQVSAIKATLTRSDGKYIFSIEECIPR